MGKVEPSMESSDIGKDATIVEKQTLTDAIGNGYTYGSRERHALAASESD